MIVVVVVVAIVAVIFLVCCFCNCGDDINGGTGLIGRTVDWYKKTFHNKTPEDLI